MTDDNSEHRYKKELKIEVKNILGGKLITSESKKGGRFRIPDATQSDIRKIQSSDKLIEYPVETDRCSGCYPTLFLGLRDGGRPHAFVFCISDEVIKPKSLTLQKLGLSGRWESRNAFVEKLLSSFDELVLKSRIKNLLKKLIDREINPNIEYRLTKDELANTGQFKDFSEILAAIRFLSGAGSVDIPKNSNHIGTDFDSINSNNHKESFNVKNNGGSGQSFKPLSDGFNRLLDNDMTDEEKSYFDVCKILSNETHGTAIDNIESVFLIFSKMQNSFGHLILDLMKYHWIPKNLDEHKKDINEIYNKNGFPSLSKFPKELSSKENLRYFTIQTAISNCSDIEIVTKLITPVQSIRILQVTIGEYKTEIRKLESKNCKYKLQYWANSGSPFNNHLGYKTIENVTNFGGKND